MMTARWSFFVVFFVFVFFVFVTVCCSAAAVRLADNVHKIIESFVVVVIGYLYVQKCTGQDSGFGWTYFLVHATLSEALLASISSTSNTTTGSLSVRETLLPSVFG